jgi:pimeloyl-[acyl-carrier protein] methyl ester esterase
MKRATFVILNGWAAGRRAFQTIEKDLDTMIDFHYMDWNGITDYTGKTMDYIQKIQAPVHILGWSLGSLIALETASLIPDKIKSLVLFAPTGCFTRKENYLHGWKGSVIERMKQKLTTDREQLLKSFYQSMFTDEEISRGMPELFLNDSENLLTAELISGLDYLLNRDHREKWKTLNIPAILIAGEKDVICPPSAAEYMKNTRPEQTELEIIKNAGHAPFLSSPNVCIHLIEEWMKKYD